MPAAKLDNVPKVRALLRSHFLSGLLVVVPSAVIAWIAVLALKGVWGLVDLMPLAWRPEAWLPDPFLAWLVDAALVLALTLSLALGISLVGWVSKQFLGQKILDFFTDHVIQRIPVLRSVYSAVDQFLRAIAAEGGHQFHRVVYIEYPRKGLWSLAFVTGPVRGVPALDGFLNVYVPTTPNPTSGFHLMVPEADVVDSPLTVEDAFRTLLSLGIAQTSTSGKWKLPDREPKAE